MIFGYWSGWESMGWAVRSVGYCRGGGAGSAVGWCRPLRQCFGIYHGFMMRGRRRVGSPPGYIPCGNVHVEGLDRVNRDLVSFVESRSPQTVTIVDTDATVLETNKEGALHSYRGFKAYQPLNGYWAEQDLVVQLAFSGMEDQLPLPTMEFREGERYKVFGLVTNRPIPGDDLIRWYRGRCGESEEVHSAMKEDLAGGKFPSRGFGGNVVWWAMMILALNLSAAMKRLVLDKGWVSKRLKAIQGDSICAYRSARWNHGALEAVDHTVGLWASIQ